MALMRLCCCNVESTAAVVFVAIVSMLFSFRGLFALFTNDIGTFPYILIETGIHFLCSLLLLAGALTRTGILYFPFLIFNFLGIVFYGAIVTMIGIALIATPNGYFEKDATLLLIIAFAIFSVCTAINIFFEYLVVAAYSKLNSRR